MIEVRDRAQALELFLPALIDRCAEITRSKGFDTSQHATQVALIATEVAEALHEIRPRDGMDTRMLWLIAKICTVCDEIEEHRREVSDYRDASEVKDPARLLEELADVVIRVLSYVGGNGCKAGFLRSLSDKLEKNAARPQKHGKGF